MKTCFTCKTLKPNSGFYKNKTKRDGLADKCKTCCVIYYKKYYQNDIEKSRQYERSYRKNNPATGKKAALKYNYGITWPEWTQLFEKQGGRCAICNTPKPLCVDHCHKTKKIRGLICATCNTGIGMLKDSASLALNAHKYLKKHLTTAADVIP